MRERTVGCGKETRGGGREDGKLDGNERMAEDEG